MLRFLRRLDQDLLLTPKILYFFINLQFFTIHFFRTNFAVEKFKIDEGLFGKIAGICLFATFFTNIAMATFSDRLNKQRLYFFVMLLFNAIIFQLFFLIGTNKILYWGVFILYLITNNSMLPVLDKLTLEYLGRIPNVGTDTYGRQRLWGTIAYVVTTFIVDKIISEIDPVSKKKSYNFDNIRIYNLLTSIIALSLILFLLKVSGRASVRRDISASWKLLLKNGQYFFFIFIILLNGITRGSMTLYLSTYFHSVVRLKQYVISPQIPRVIAFSLGILNTSPSATVSFFGVLLEMVILYYAKIITNTVGLYWPLLLAQAAQLLRFMGYSLMHPNTKHAFPIICMLELFKGLNFGLTHVSAVQIATSLCPPHLKTTSQTIYSGTFVGLASIFSGLIFGSIMTDVKEKKIDEQINVYKEMFNYNIGISVFCVLIFVAKYWFRDGLLTFGRNERVVEKIVDDAVSSSEEHMELGVNVKTNQEVIEKDGILNDNE